MTQQLIRLACERLELDEASLARKLEVSTGCLRSWKREAPIYAQLALAALIAGLDMDLVCRLDNLRRIAEQARATPRRVSA
jgi:hypothetical protein